MLKPTGSSDQFAHTISQHEKNRQQLFLDKMKDFPCSFNLGCTDLDIDDKKYKGFHIIEPDLHEHRCEYLKQNLEDTKGEDFEAIMCRENLLTRVHAELGDLPMAMKLNEKTLKTSSTQNLVALGNAAFLFHLNKEVEKRNDVLENLEKLKKNPHYKDLKVMAILEQAYEYRKFGGAKYLLCSMALFDFALPMGPQDERLQFMRAMVYRRCTHIGIYIQDPENIDRHQFGLEAAKELFRLGNEARDSVIRSAALIELAYLKHNDDMCEEGNSKQNNDAYGESSVFNNITVVILDKKEWFGIVGHNDWKTLCFKSLEASNDNLSEKVLKIAGQLFRYFRSDDDLRISEVLLKNAIDKKPTNRAHHHLGLTYRKMAINCEKNVGLVQRCQQVSQNSKFAQRGQMQQWPLSQDNTFEQRGQMQQWPLSQDNNFEQRGQMQHWPLSQDNNFEQRGQMQQWPLSQDNNFEQRGQMQQWPLSQDNNFEQRGQMQQWPLSQDNNFEQRGQMQQWPLSQDNNFEQRGQMQQWPLTQGNNFEQRGQMQQWPLSQDNNFEQRGQMQQWSLTQGNNFEQRGQMRQWPSSQNNNFEQHGLMQQRRTLKNNNFAQRGQVYQSRPSQDNNVTSINLLPQPPDNTRPRDLDKHLKSALKVPRQKIKPFSENNPYTKKAVEQFKKAIETSREQNIPSFYDLCYMYAQMGLFDESKKTCLKLIEACNKHYSGMQYQTYVVNAYSLYGMCCILEAEKVEDNTKKIALMDESEKMLIQAVRLASHLAAGIPELATAATDLWEAFSTLKRKFDFDGSTSSKEKLFHLCKLVTDYRYIEEMDTILSKDPSVWENVNALERCLESYLNLGHIDGALLFLDMISLHPETTFKRGNSLTVQKLMLEVAKRTLSNFLEQIQGGNSLTLPDQIWKRMFQDNFDTNQSFQKYDIVIVQDITDDNEARPGTRSDKVAGCLKDILMRVCGLNVVIYHEVGLPGGMLLDQYIDTICKAHVAVCVLAGPWSESPSLEACLEKTLTFSEAAGKSSSLDAHAKIVDKNLPRVNIHKKQTNNPDVESPLSEMFKFIISTCTKLHVQKKKPAHILSVLLGEMQPDDLPHVLQGLPSLYLSDTDVDRLSSALRDDVCDETVNLIMTIFKAVIRKE